MFRELKVGADPEVFLVKADGSPMSAEGLIGGSKMEPFLLPFMGPGYAVQEDNVAAEFNIPPASNGIDFSDSISKVLRYLKDVSEVKGLNLAFVSALHFPAEQLMTDHAQTLGCEPDYNAWTNAMNPKPQPPASLRTAAGHVHVGWMEPQEGEKLTLIKMLDLFLGVPAVLASKKNERRSLYGRAGAWRNKKYGAEYRVLDNFWLPDENNRGYVFQQVQNAVYWLRRKGLQYWNEEFSVIDTVIQDSINLHLRGPAAGLMEDYSLEPFPVSYA